jgi:hypothetical protein
MIEDAVRDLRARLGLPVDPTRRGPVTLDRFFQEMNGPRMSHFALPALTRSRVVRHLRAQGIRTDELGNPEERLAGFLFAAGTAAWAFVTADDILPRRRFTAAHELGHAVLHRETMGQFVADVSISETDDGVTRPEEREANRFAAELLMPEEVIRARAEELRREHGGSPRGVLEYRLAAELIVSAEAIRYRLTNLGIRDD